MQLDLVASLRRMAIVDLAKLLAVLVLLGTALSHLVPELANAHAAFAQHDLFHLAPFNYAIAVFAILGLILSPFLRSHLLRMGLVSAIVSSLVFELLARAIADQPFRAVFLQLAWQERHTTTQEMIVAYLPVTAPILLAFVAVWTILCLPPRQLCLNSWGRILCPACAIAGFAGSLVVAQLNIPGMANPSPWSVHSKLLSAAFLRERPYEGPKSPIDYLETVTPQIDNIILVIDESIRGDILEINGGWPNTTPYVASLTSGVVNFGVSVSTANCSALARYFLRTGARQTDAVPWNKAIEQLPTFWAYARHAGFRSAHLDAWPSPFGHSGMTKSEKALIDNYIQVNHMPPMERDKRLVEQELASLLAGSKSVRQFVLIEKYGLHYPYSNKFPPAFAAANGLHRPSDSLDNTRELHRTYAVGVKWSVDEFLKALLPRIDLKRSVVIYTSDHGQAITDDAPKTLHCTSGKQVSPGEAFVPLLVFTENAALLDEFTVAASSLRDKTSHFELFPTILRLLGYDQAWVRSKFGVSLLDAGPRETPRFLTGLSRSELVWRSAR